MEDTNKQTHAPTLNTFSNPSGQAEKSSINDSSDDTSNTTAQKKPLLHEQGPLVSIQTLLQEGDLTRTSNTLFKRELRKLTRKFYKKYWLKFVQELRQHHSTRIPYVWALKTHTVLRIDCPLTLRLAKKFSDEFDPLYKMPKVPENKYALNSYPMMCEYGDCDSPRCDHCVYENTRTEKIIAEAGINQQDTLTQEENTTFTDQRETVTDDGYITTQIMPQLQTVSMPESEWHVRNIMSKPIPFWTGEWSTSTLGSIIASWDLPGAALFGPHYNLVSTFTFFRGHPKIRFQVNGTKFHAGRLIAAFVPHYLQAANDGVLYSVSNLTSLPHVILDASIANSGVINLPFVHMNTYFNTAASTRNWQTLGRLMLVVFNKLRAADSSSQSIGVTAWISFDNCELHQPCYAHVPALPGIVTPKAPILAESGVEGLVKSLVPTLTDMVAPELSTLGNVLGGSSDQDKPTDPVEIQRWVPNIVTGIAQGDGIDRSSRLCLVAGSYTIPDADLISTTNDDMNLLELCKIPVRLDLFDWKNSQASGTRLAHIPICPNLFTGYSTSDKVKPSVEVITPTMLAYISRYFKFWRGSLRYKIQIIASQMHTGRLMISYGAGINLTDAQSFNKASYLNTYTIDLQEKHEVEFVVPFLCERPWLRCDRFRKYDETGAQEKELWNWENLGYLDVYILNRLSNPDSVSSAVAINVFISAGDDFELAFPSELDAFQGIGDVIPPKAPTPIYAESLATEETVTTRTDTGSITLTKGNGMVKSAGPTTMSENAMNLKTLLRRYTKVYANRGEFSQGAHYLTFPNTPSLSGVNKCFNSNKGVQCRTALSHFSELFTFWRGSLRYKLTFQAGMSATETQNSDFLIKVFHVPGVFATGNFLPQKLTTDDRAMYAAFESQGTIIAGTRQQGSLEFEIPFYTPYTQLRTIRGGIANSRSATGLVFIIIDCPLYEAGAHLTVDLYQAAGDDFTLNYLRAAPRIQFINAYDTTRQMDDNSTFIHSVTPQICSGASTMPHKEEEEEEGKIVAEALTDYIPGVQEIRTSTASFERTTAKVDIVCDTAQHLLQQASKKLGLAKDDEEDEDSTPTTTLLEDFSTLTNPLTSILEGILSFIKLVPQQCADYFKPNLTITDLLVEVSNLTSGFTAFLNSQNYLAKICAIVTIVSTLLKDCATVVKNSIYHFVTHIMDNLSRPQPQPAQHGSIQGNDLPVAETAVFDLVAPLTASLAVGIGMIGFKKIPTDKETIDMCKGISEKLKLFNFSSSALQNVKNLWGEIRGLMQWCIDYVLTLLAPHLLAQLKLDRNFGNIEQWAQEIDALDNVSYADKIHYDYEFKNHVYKLVDQGKYYNALLLEGRCGRAANIIREYVRKITEIGNHCERSKNELPFRKDPFCIFIFGGTNIGKSGSITTIGFDILDALGYPQHNRWCAINCTEKFFSENYRQQAAVYFDDFSTFTSEEQYQKFFNLKANTAYPLDMAFRKGEYFNSDFIFATTNTPYPEPNFVTNHDALLRRRDLLIEADWCDDERIQQALQNGENMAQFRRLDNTHLKFRIRHSVNSEHPPGPWMTYAAIVAHCTEEARIHLRRQQDKLTHDLTRAGYIVPRAEALEMRRLCIEACKNSPRLALFNPEIWERLSYDQETDTFDMFLDTDDPINEEWIECIQFHETAGVDLQKILKENSYMIKPKITLSTKIRHNWNQLKELLKHNYENIIREHPWIAQIGKWSLIFTAAFAGLGLLYFGAKKVAHGCLCVTLRHYGYRCGFCGKWPKLKNSRDPDWTLSEWQSLYGQSPYIDGHVTPLQEESALLSQQKRMRVEVTEPLIGTQNRAESVYSDITKGSKIPARITAQNSPYSTDVKGTRALKVSANTGEFSGTPNVSPKRTAESAQVEVLTETRIFPYLYKLRTLGKPGLSSQTVNGYAVGDRWLIINKHFVFGLENGDLFEIFHNGAWLQVEYVEERCRLFPNKDMIVFDMPPQFHAHKSNTHHFISEKELQYFQNGEGALCKLNPQGRNVLVENLKIKALKELNYETITGVPIYIQSAWRYTKCSTAGDCGSILVAYSNRLSGKILGIHVASSPQISYAQLITREMIEDLVKRKEGTPAPTAEAKFGNLIPPGHLGRIGKAPKGREFYQSPSTEIIPTKIHEMIAPAVSQPAVLSVNDPRLKTRTNPLRKGIEKYSFCQIPFPSQHREIVNVMMKEENRRLIRSREPQILTLKEAIVGIPELEGFERLPMNTSPGYPWILSRPKGAHGKSYLFDEETLEPVFDLQKSLDQREEKAKALERVESVWVDCLKDERRPLEKIYSGSTRMFSMPPVDFSILMRKYTLDYSVAVKNSRDFMECKVGIDPQSLDWTTLYYWLAEFSNLCVAGDFSRFDGSIPAELIHDMCDDINHFYEEFGQCTEEDKNVRKILFDELIHTVHIARDEYYMTHLGNKSGNPLTVILNSNINKRYMALAWLGLCEQKNKMEYFSMSKFKDNVRMAIYGDDNILAIKQEVIEWYNQETIAEYLFNFNITYTNEEKTGLTKFKTLDECSFLKQTFHDHEKIKMIKVPHMKMSTITELLNWTRASPDQDELLKDNCNDALRFSYFLGEKFFNQLRNKIYRALEEIDLDLQLKTFMDFHLWFLTTIGVLKAKPSAEGFLTEFAETDTSRVARAASACTLGPLTWLLTTINGPVKDDRRIREPRLAVCIPSGEGKSWLARQYPDLFIDHDTLTLPALEEHTKDTSKFKKWLAIGNTMLNPQKFDTPPHDKRILLTHHPNATNRTIWRQYVLPYPNFNRNNFLNRRILDSPICLSRAERNAELVAFALSEVKG
jgi:hypothetical protein